MASTTQLPRISSLVDRLAPLAKKQRGMRIEAEDWNTLVDVISGILEIDRAQEQAVSVKLEERFAPRTHDHTGQVTTAWLAPELQDLLGGGGSGSVLTRSALAEANQKIQGMGKEVARLTEAVERQQKLLDAAAVDELDRSRTLREFEKRFASVEDLRTLVTTLNGQVSGLSKNVDQVLKLREALTDPTGAPINVAGLREEVTALNELRENLKGVDGTLLRLRDIELKLNELSDVVGVTGSASLETRLASLSADIETRLDAKYSKLNTALREELLAANATSEAKLKQELGAQIASNRTELEQMLDKRLVASESSLTAAFDAKLAATSKTVLNEAAAATKASIDSALASIPGQVQKAVDAATASLHAQLSDELRTFTTTTIGDEIAAVEKRLNQQVAAIDSRVTAMDKQLPVLVEQSLNEAVRGLEEQLMQSITKQIATAQASLESAVNARVSATVNSSLAEVDARITRTVDTRLADLDSRISQTVAKAVSDLPDLVAAEVAALNLTQQIQESARSVTQQLRTELSQAIADQQAKTTAAINSTVTLLRGEIASTAKSTQDAVRTELNANVAVLRTDLTKTVNDRIQEIRINRPIS
jgi:hypothetical protein